MYGIRVCARMGSEGRESRVRNDINAVLYIIFHEVLFNAVGKNVTSANQDGE